MCSGQSVCIANSTVLQNRGVYIVYIEQFLNDIRSTVNYDMHTSLSQYSRRGSLSSIDECVTS